MLQNSKITQREYHAESAAWNRKGDTAKYRPIDGARLLLRLILLAVLMLIAAARPAAAANSKYFNVKIGTKKLLVGEKTQLTVKGKKTTFKFSTSNKKVASVNKKGVITAKKKGTAVITVTGSWKNAKGKKYTQKKKYTLRVYNCKLNQTSVSLTQGETYRKLRLKGETLKRKIQWSSSDSAVVSVSSSGVLNANRTGSAVISVNVGSYRSFRCSVTVQATSLGSWSGLMLVNAGHVYGSVNLEAELPGKMKTGQPVYFTVANPSLGHMTGSIYYADAQGNNSITAYRGGYSYVLKTVQTCWMAHRGYMDLYPENTLDAFEAAFFAGAGKVETDLHFTKDGEPVLIHDRTVTKMTNGTGYVRRMTYEQVRGLEIDNGNGLAKCTNRRIPNLGEYLEICRRYGMVACIEIKELGPTKTEDPDHYLERWEIAARRIYSEAIKHGMLHRTQIISYYPQLLKVFREQTGPTIPVSPLGTTAPELAALHLANAPWATETIFGPHKTMDYSPLTGRKGLASSAY